MKNNFLILITISLFCSFNCSDKKKEGVIYNLPEGFTGIAVVIFDQKDGDEKLYYDPKTNDGVNLRVYNIPENGILKTKFKPLHGETPINTIRVFYNFYNDSSRQEIKISGHDFIDEGKSILQAKSFKHGHYCFPQKIPYVSFEVGHNFHFIDSSGNELIKWKDYVSKMIEKHTGVTCEQKAIKTR